MQEWLQLMASQYLKDHAFLLDDNENINYKVLNNFLNKYGSKKF